MRKHVTSIGRLGANGRAFVIAGVAVAALSTFLTSLTTARGLTATDRGIYLQVLAVMLMVGTYATLGVEMPLIGLSAGRLRIAADGLRRTRSWYLIAVVCLIPLTIVSLGWIDGAPPLTPSFALLVAVMVWSTVTALRQVTLLKVAQNYRALGVSIALTPTVFFLGTLILLALSQLDVTSILAAYVFASLVQNLYLVVVISLQGRSSMDFRERDPPVGERATTTWQLIKLGLRDLAVATPSGIIASVELLLVGVLVSSEAASIFAVAKTVTSPLALIQATVANQLPAELATLSIKARLRRLERATLMVLLLGGVAAGSCLAFAYLFVPALYGGEYAPAVLVAAILAPGVVASLGARVATVSLRVSLSYLSTSLIWYSMLLATVVGGWLLLPRYGLIPFCVLLTTLSVIRFALLHVAARSFFKRSSAEADSPSEQEERIARA
jgi:O-antigen/teichoic acid export membrane protein